MEKQDKIYVVKDIKHSHGDTYFSSLDAAKNYVIHNLHVVEFDCADVTLCGIDCDDTVTCLIFSAEVID